MRTGGGAKEQGAGELGSWGNGVGEGTLRLALGTRKTDDWNTRGSQLPASCLLGAACCLSCAAKCQTPNSRQAKGIRN